MPGLFSSMAQGVRAASRGPQGRMGAAKGFGILAAGGAAVGGLLGAHQAGTTGFWFGMAPGGETPFQKGGRYAKSGGMYGAGAGAAAATVAGALLARRFFGSGMTRPFNRIRALGRGRDGVSGLLR